MSAKHLGRCCSASFDALCEGVYRGLRSKARQVGGENVQTYETELAYTQGLCRLRFEKAMRLAQASSSISPLRNLPSPSHVICVGFGFAHATNHVSPLPQNLLLLRQAQCAATERAGQLAGLEKVKLMREPEAAALAYGLDKVSRVRCCFGGGSETCFVTCPRRSGRGEFFSVVGVDLGEEGG